MENEDNEVNENNTIPKKDSDGNLQIASALYIPRISIKFDDFKHLIEDLALGNLNKVRVATKIGGSYFIFCSIQEMESCQEVINYLHSNLYFPVRGFKVRMEFNEGTINFGESAKIKGSPEWQKEKVETIIGFFVNNYNQEFGMTSSQIIFRGYNTVLIFLVLALALTVFYTWLFFNPNLFSSFLDVCTVHLSISLHFFFHYPPL